MKASSSRSTGAFEGCSALTCPPQKLPQNALRGVLWPHLPPLEASNAPRQGGCSALTYPPSEASSPPGGPLLCWDQPVWTNAAGHYNQQHSRASSTAVAAAVQPWQHQDSQPSSLTMAVQPWQLQYSRGSSSTARAAAVQPGRQQYRGLSFRPVRSAVPSTAASSTAQGGSSTARAAAVQGPQFQASALRCAQ